ncbi:MAG: EAL domain-containing response regulator [Pseudomonadota bacterium]
MTNSALIVDDDPMMQIISAAALRSAGVETVEVASNGSSALENIRSAKQQLDLVVSDLNMPDLDGLQFLRLLSDQGYEGNIIIASGEDDVVLKAAMDMAGAMGLSLVGALKKPVTPERLIALVSKANSEHRSQRSPTAPPIKAIDVRNAIDRREITPFFQPKFHVDTGDVVGVEALARWNSPVHGQIAPDIFVKIAEDTDLVSDLTFLMLDRSLEMLSRLRPNGSPISVAINTDPTTINDETFPDIAVERCQAYGVPNSSVTFEITERNLLDEKASSIEVLARLRMLKFGVSVDDFGTGHTNLRQLCVYPFTELKIDRSFLKGAMTDRRHLVCLRAMAKLGKDLDMSIVAEGIETEKDVVLLQEIGVDSMQGYYLKRPVPADEFLAWYLTYLKHRGHHASAASA